MSTISASIVTGVLQLPPIIVFGLASAAGLILVARIYASATPLRRFEPSVPRTLSAHVPAGG